MGEQLIFFSVFVEYKLWARLLHTHTKKFSLSELTISLETLHAHTLEK